MGNEIFEQSEILLQSKNNIEMLDVIYDTLFQNIQFPQFDLDKVDFQERDVLDNTLTFVYNGQTYTLTIH